MNKTPSILIVDDDSFLLDMYSVKFKERGFEVLTAGGGEDAIQLLEEGAKPHVIMLDLVMPGVDGFEVIKRVREKGRGMDDVAIVVLSNQGEQDDIKRARDLGADDYFIKANMVPSEVVQKIEAIIHKT